MTPRKPLNGPILTVLAVAFVAGCAANASDAPREPHTAAESPVEAGRYLVTVAGCNDCHTDGYLFNEGNVPEPERFLGSSLGWRGPWGTSYARNLRLTVTTITEDAWVQMLQARKGLPPMPWMNVNQMAEVDMRAIYQYLRSLGPAGEQPPNPVPPDQEPTTPFISLAPVEPVVP
jgi:mono/diheme cytochrome c family protein